MKHVCVYVAEYDAVVGLNLHSPLEEKTYVLRRMLNFMTWHGKVQLGNFYAQVAAFNLCFPHC